MFQVTDQFRKGRFLVTDSRELVYKCKNCEMGLTFHEDPLFRMPPHFEFPAVHGIMYYFPHCFNVVIGTRTVMIDLKGETDSPMRQVFCIGCGSHIGFRDDWVADTSKKNEGYFYINRLKLHGPPDGSDDENPGCGYQDSDYDTSGNEED